MYWVASSAGTQYFVKLANYGADAQDVTVSIPGLTSGKLTVLADNNPDASNTVNQTLVVPSAKEVAGNGSFSFSLPAWSVAILDVN